MQLHYLGVRRGIARAGVLSALLLGSAAVLTAFHTPRADGETPVPVTRVVEPTVAPTRFSVREMIRQNGVAVQLPRSAPRVIPRRGRFLQPGAAAAGTPEAPRPHAGTQAPPPAPDPLVQFDTVRQADSLIQSVPPDDALAVGPRQVVSVGNSAIVILDKQSGQRLFARPLDTFYQGKNAAGDIFDPRAAFDETSGRFYVLTVAQDGTSKAGLQLAVSLTDDAMGAWNVYTFDVAENSNKDWLDFPTLGFNSKAVFVGGNTFPFDPTQPFVHAALRVFDKSKLLAGAAVSPVALFTPGGVSGAFTIQPARSHDQTDVEWMVDTGLTGNSVRLWRLSDPLAAAPTITTSSLSVPDYVQPPTQNPEGATHALDWSDGRVGNAVLANGDLWVAHGVGESINGATRGTARVYQIDAAGGSVKNTFTFSDPTSDFGYPSVDVDPLGGALVGFDGVAPNRFVGIYYAVKKAADTTFSAPKLMSAGTFTQDAFDPGLGVSRWGDYSDTAADPTRVGVIWHQNELGAAANTWVMHVGAVPVDAQAITILTPKSGENVLAGSSYTITWSNVGVPAADKLKIQLSRDGGRTYPETLTPAAGVDNTGTFTVTLAGPATNLARLKITDLTTPTVVALMDSTFSIVTGSLSIVSPNGGEVAIVGRTLPIQWTTADFAAQSTQVKIELSRDGGATFPEVIAANAPNTGFFNWNVTGPAVTNARVRVSAALLGGNNFAFSDTSHADFEIRDPSALTLLLPKGGETFLVGQTVTLKWTSTGFIDHVRVELSRSGGTSWETILADVPNTGSAQWTVTGPGTKEGRIRVTSLTQDPNFTSVQAQTIGVFSITVSQLVVTSPRSGTTLIPGRTQLVTYSATGLPAGTMRVSLSTDGGSRFTDVATGAPNSGSISFVVPNTPATGVILRVSSEALPSIFGEVTGLTIGSPAPPTLSLLSPVGGERWEIGSKQTIQWSGSVVGQGTVTISLSRDGGRTFNPILSSVPNSGTAAWTVTGPATTRAKIRVSWNGGSPLSADSRAVFRIQTGRRPR